MPTPQPARRAWGTRFDSLVEPTPSKGATTSPDIGLHSTSPSRETTANDSVKHDPDATPTSAEKERSNPAHDHDYPRSVSSGAPQSIDTSSPAQARMPHDASVFVASLPSHVPEAELQVQLSEHLSQHATIKHIKLIRDNRGAVCAFVQVESAAQATALITACNLSQFMDRHIRCETARAFRTLLVSWRPAGQNGVQGDSGQIDVKEAQEGVQKGRGGTGNALRLRRCRGTRYIQVTHGADALPCDLAQLPNFSTPRADDPLSGTGVFFPAGIKEGDFESLKYLLSAFGALEFITPFDPSTQAQRLGPPYYASEPQSRDESTFIRGGEDTVQQEEGGNPIQENGEPKRSQPQMWAAKWEHRNDAVSAITALQYVPNLFICWSHTYGRPHHPAYAQAQAQAPYPPNFVHSRASSGFYTQPSYPTTPYTPVYPRIDGAVPDAADSNPHTPSLPHHEPATNDSVEVQWAVVHPAAGQRLQQLHAQALGSPSIIDIVKKEQAHAQKPITFSESEFPPLGRAIGGRGRGKRGAWPGRRNFVRAGAPSPPPIPTILSPSHLHAEPESPTSAVPHTPDLDPVVEPSPVTPGFPITPRTPSSGYTPSSDEMKKDAVYASAQNFVTQGFTIPYPSAQGFNMPYVSAHSFPAQSFPTRRGYENGLDKTPDGRELFVGGLDVEMWNDERLKSVFGRYGTIDEVRFVRPGYHAPAHRRAFAFVKFTDQEAPQRAIKEEHLRVYEDSKIKVQLRSANPPKRWGYRGRGRFQHGLVRAERGSLEFDHDSSIEEAPADTAEEEPVKEEPVVEDTGHVRFASAPAAVGVNVEGAAETEHEHEFESVQADTSDVFEDATECDPVLDDAESNPALDAAESTSGAKVEELEGEPEALAMGTGSMNSSMSLSDSDGAANASMEVQTHSADTTVTLADGAAPFAPESEFAVQYELQAEPDSLTISSATPPPSNPDATSTYAPSSSSAGSAPTSTGYYPPTPSWIPPYAVPSTPYGAYGYYPQQVPGQSGADGSNGYPWMATVYRNVVPFVPWFNPPPGVELAPAPVRPTGYIQRDAGGIFIPVYPPERLGQYMSTSGAAVDQSQAQSQTGGPSIGNWQNLPPHPQLYMIPQQAPAQNQSQQQQQQHHAPIAGNGWITGPPPVSAHMRQGMQPLDPSSAPPPYATPHVYLPSPSSAAPTHIHPVHPPLKHPNRRGAEYPHQQHRLNRPSPHRRGAGGPGVNAGVEQSFATFPTQVAMPPSGSGSEWNWNAQNR